MIAIDCPLCDGAATTDAALTIVTCDGCGVAVEIAGEAVSRALDVAA